jgi:hypothetical protein
MRLVPMIATALILPPSFRTRPLSRYEYCMPSMTQLTIGMSPVGVQVAG